MKKLSDVLNSIEVMEISGDRNAPVTGITFNSRTATPGSAFVAVKGTHADGHDFIPQAISNGAGIIVCRNNAGRIQAGLPDEYHPCEGKGQCQGAGSDGFQLL